LGRRTGVPSANGLIAEGGPKKVAIIRIREDVRAVAGHWFDHDAHESVEQFVVHPTLAYFDFATRDRYLGWTRFSK
jgi:hypothetical protein